MYGYMYVCVYVCVMCHDYGTHVYNLLGALYCLPHVSKLHKVGGFWYVCTTASVDLLAYTYA